MYVINESPREVYWKRVGQEVIVILCALLVTGCSFGLIKVTHKDGELPKIRVETPNENTKIRIKKEGVYIIYRKEF